MTDSLIAFYDLMLDFFDIPHLLVTYGYPGIFIIVFLESGIFFPLPGDSLLFTAGLFAGALNLNIFFLVPMIFVATFLGGLAGYWVGENIIRFQNSAFGRRFLRPEYITRAHEFFERYGVFAVTMARFVPIVRTFVPIVAGVAKMNYREFIKWSLMGSFLWSTIVTLLGFFLGKYFPGIKNSISWIAVLIVLVSLLPFIVELFRKKGTKASS